MTAKTPVQREIKPNKKHPFTIHTGPRTFKGSVIVVISKDEKGKETTEIVESKTRFIPAQIVVSLMAGLKPEAVKKLESKLVPLKEPPAPAKDK